MKTLLIVAGILIAWLVLGFLAAIVFGKIARHGSGEDLEQQVDELEPGDFEPICAACGGRAADCPGHCLEVKR